ncbi:hypothetical protein MNEG_16481 [Monoraphidium neglectum]|uniref:J domain-containing protein n=1 Tax=Monoraphidium neglectum TaxID=145388 RepID=A0A0D2K5M9_9CHLO|nr:hypothetical protein MNEG_16481 [Monoraphidium neglectum]KIY91483.1 hypothetical protein MNEG_16481 [Monoraphidium neglectum]|eukprot:XP_013890503.1 hypothetical protein MNEG_16481 [Monoraphidium neglectum]
MRPAGGVLIPSPCDAGGVFEFQTPQAPDISKFVLKSGLVDFYELLGVDDDATPEEIKRAYRSTCKECHPDFLGDVGHNICILLNEAYEVLMDGTARAAYDSQLEAALADEADGYTGEPLSKWMPALKPRMAKNENPAEDRAVFVVRARVLPPLPLLLVVVVVLLLPLLPLLLPLLPLLLLLLLLRFTPI